MSPISNEVQKQMIKMRKMGRSYREISYTCNISISTVSKYCKNVHINKIVFKKMFERCKFNRRKGLLVIKRNRDKVIQTITERVRRYYLNIRCKKELFPIFCSLLFWTEGGKFNESTMTFTNSDPIMIKTFLSLLRNSFNIDERRFRLCLHLHEYHVESEMLKYWSLLCGISRKQFYKVYVKKHTGVRKREGYKGCLSVRYNDHNICKSLRQTYMQFPVWINTSK